ncbi:unnamed protein product [Alopecurus aequalis]
METREPLLNQARTGALPADSTPETIQPSQPTPLRSPTGRQICVRKQFVLKDALHALSLKMFEAMTLPVGNGQLLGSVYIDVPTHDEYPSLQKRRFYGDYKLTEEDALESAHLASLLYLQKSGIIVVDDVNLNELRNCEAKLVAYQHKLLAASSWATMFQERAESVQAKLAIAEQGIKKLRKEIPPQQPLAIKEEPIPQAASVVKKEVSTPPLSPGQSDTGLPQSKKLCIFPTVNYPPSMHANHFSRQVLPMIQRPAALERTRPKMEGMPVGTHRWCTIT